MARLRFPREQSEARRTSRLGCAERRQPLPSEAAAAPVYRLPPASAACTAVLQPFVSEHQ